MSGLYFGSIAEQSLKRYLKKNNEVLKESLLHFELINYHKTLFGAKAILRMTSNAPYFDENIGDVTLIAKLLNGPLFVTKRGISIGNLRWYVSIDESALSERERQNLRVLFPNVLPHLIIQTDFEGRINYSSVLSTAFAKIVAFGVYELKSKSHQGEITFDNLRYDSFPNQILADKVKFIYKYHIGINYDYGLDSTLIITPSLLLKSQPLKDPVKFKVRAITNVVSENGYFSGSIETIFDNVNKTQLPIDEARLSLNFEGLSSNGFFRFNEKKAEIDNLRKQAKWSLEEIGEFPEGQDQIWQLYDEIDDHMKQLQPIMWNTIFAENGIISLKVNSFNSTGKSELNGTLSRISTQRQKSIKKRQGGLDRFIWSTLQGEANIELDKNLFSYLENRTAIKKSKFKLSLKNSKLLME